MTYNFYPRRKWAAGHNIPAGSLTDVQDELYETSVPFLLPPGAQPLNLYPVETGLLSGRVRGDGMMKHEWTWGFMPIPTFQHVMTTYFPNNEKSVPMTILERMHEFDDSYQTLNVYMIRPESGKDYRVDGGRVVELKLRFNVITRVAELMLLVLVLVSTNSFGSPSIDTGAGSATLYVDPDSFGVPVVGRGTVNLAPTKLTDADSFGTPAITTTVNLTATKFTDGDTFGTAVITTGSVDLAPTAYTDGDSFGTPAVTDVYPLTATLYDDADSFGTPDVSQT